MNDAAASQSRYLCRLCSLASPFHDLKTLEVPEEFLFLCIYRDLMFLGDKSVREVVLGCKLLS